MTREEDVAMAKVLFILSGATYWVLKDGTRYATGYWAEEFANPYKIVTDAGHEVVVATPNGVTPNVDMMSLRPEMAGGVKDPSDDVTAASLRSRG
jgi:putative intracellular protease/amidase